MSEEEKTFMSVHTSTDHSSSADNISVITSRSINNIPTAYPVLADAWDSEDEDSKDKPSNKFHMLKQSEFKSMNQISIKNSTSNNKNKIKVLINLAPDSKPASYTLGQKLLMK